MPGSKETSSNHKDNKRERLWRFARNVNILGAAAMVGAGVLLPPVAPAAFALGALNAGQAGFFEVMRSRAKSKPEKKKST